MYGLLSVLRDSRRLPESKGGIGGS